MRRVPKYTGMIISSVAAEAALAEIKQEEDLEPDDFGDEEEAQEIAQIESYQRKTCCPLKEQEQQK